jgi:hypothetical protein
MRRYSAYSVVNESLSVAGSTAVWYGKDSIMRLIPTTVDLKNRKHIARIQEVLLFLDSGIAKDSDEITKKTFGVHTSRALSVSKKN